MCESRFRISVVGETPHRRAESELAPKIDGYLRSGKTYFVVVGAGHMGGPNGLLAMLRARGYKIEQI